MDKIKQALAEASLTLAAHMRRTADRLEAAAHAEDWACLAETQLSTHVQDLGWIRGAAYVVMRIGTLYPK